MLGIPPEWDHSRFANEFLPILANLVTIDPMLDDLGSLVVQTSTGFGDIAPVSPLARTLATLQAMTGQIFMTVLLARLVSLEIATRGPRTDR